MYVKSLRSSFTVNSNLFHHTLNTKPGHGSFCQKCKCGMFSLQVLSIFHNETLFERGTNEDSVTQI